MQQAVESYFSGERLEMIVILIGCVVALLATVWLYLVCRDGFSTALLAVIVPAALLFGGTAGLLLVRDRGAPERLLSSRDEAAIPDARLRDEQKRIGTILANYRYYRWAAIVLLATALAGILLFSAGWGHGVATGLLLVAAAQTAIDHYSQQRASIYAAALARAHRQEAP